MSDTRNRPAPSRAPDPAAPDPRRQLEDPGAAAGPVETDLERLVGWLDRRTGVADLLRAALTKVFPDHWSFLLGELALFCFLILLATGTFMSLFFVPDARDQVYAGSYAPLKGQDVSAAFASVMRLSFEVTPGLLIRQMHHWAALVFVAAIATHLMRVFFTAAFRKPRELNWILGVGLLLLAMAEGMTGYSLPDDLLSGSGIRIFYSVMESIPFVGPGIAAIVFGGPYGTPDILNRLFVIHILLIPGILIAGIAIHVGLVFLQKHSQYKRGAARQDNVVGLPFWPQQTFRSLGLLALTAAVIGLLGGVVQINPVWIYGPYVPFTDSVPAQPDWYLGWLEGVLRLGPSFEPNLLGIVIPEPFLPALAAPALAVAALLVWPWIDAWVSGDHGPHNLLDWWWEQPFRAAAGAVFTALFLVCTLAGANDVLAALFQVPVARVTVILLWALPIMPAITGVVVLFMARQRRRREHQAGEGIAAHRPSAAIVARNATGGFEEVEP